MADLSPAPPAWPWDRAAPERRGEVHRTVTAGDLDDLHHVNNVRYLAWCEEVARAHAVAAAAGS